MQSNRKGWLRRLWAARNRVPSRAKTGRRQVRFEQLEDRNLLAVTVDPTHLLSGQTLSIPENRFVYLPLNSTDDTPGATVNYTVTSSDTTLTPQVIKGGITLDLAVSGGSAANNDTFSGTIGILLYGQYAPNTVAHIESLVNSGFYNGEDFFRVLHGFMGQTGSSTNNGQGGSTLGPIFDEYSTAMTFSGSPGLVAMANSGHNTGDSQFFITDPTLGSTYESPGDNEYTIFGQVTSGFDILRDILDTPVTTGPNFPGEKSTPTTPPVITSATLVTDTLNTAAQILIPYGYTSSSMITITASDGTTSSSETLTLDGVADTTAGGSEPVLDPPFFSPSFGNAAPFSINPSAPTTPLLSTQENAPVTFTVPVTDINNGATLTPTLLEETSAGNYVAATDAAITASTFVGAGYAPGSLTVTVTPNSGVEGYLNLKLQITDNLTTSQGAPDSEAFTLNVRPGTVSGSTLTVSGFSSNDGFWINFSNDGSQVMVNLDGNVQTYNTSGPGAINSIVFDGLVGADNTIFASTPPTAPATATLTASTMSIQSSTFTISANNTPHLIFYGKSSDTATITDAPGANTLTVQPTFEQFEGLNLNLTVIGAGKTYSYSNGSGTDSVVVTAAGAPYFIINPTYGYLGNSNLGPAQPGEEFFNFSQVNANDAAGTTIATVFGNGSSTFKDTISVGTMSGAGYFDQLTNFAQIDNCGTGPGDTIELDLGPNQEYVAGASAYIRYNDQPNGMAAYAVNFKSVTAVASSSDDIAVFVPTTGNENLAASGKLATLTNSLTYIASGFSTVYAYQSTGFDTDHVGVIDYVLHKVGNWIDV